MLLSRQSFYGSFENIGVKLYSAALAGALEKDQKTALSAYVLISLLKTANAIKAKNEELTFKITDIHEGNFISAFGYLENSIQNMTNIDTYTLALVLYSFKLYYYNPALALEIEKELDKRAIISNDFIYWSEINSPKQSNLNTKAADLETTAYILLAKLLSNQNINTIVSITKWINSQRNSFGGFYSTQVY